MITPADRAFVDMCVLIATHHPANKRINYQNDVCIKSGINSFKESLEYRDRYILISVALDDGAVYIEYLQPIEKLVTLIDGVGSIIVLDRDYQYLINHIIVLYKGIVRMLKEREEEKAE